MAERREEPSVSFVVPVYRTDLTHLGEMIDSVTAQTVDNWQLILVNDASGVDELTRYLDARAQNDQRIVVIHCAKNGGIARATQIGIENSTAELIALLDHDDLLRPHCAESLISAASENLDAEVFYSDEYWYFPDKKAFEYFAKPDFSPERLRAQNYFGHICAYRRELLVRIGGMREGFDGSQDYDLVLRATEAASEVVHIRDGLYDWRIHSGSVSHSKGNQPVFDAAIRAITGHLERAGIDGRVEQIRNEGVYRIHREVHGTPLVSVVIPTRGSTAKVRGKPRCMVLETVRDIVTRSTYTNVEIIVVWDSSTPKEVLRSLEELAGSRLVLVEFSDVFNFSRKINAGALAARGEFILMLNDDVQVIDAGWLETLIGLAQEPDVGIAGPVMYFESGLVQHAGHLYVGGAPGHVGLFESPENPGPAASYRCEREVSGITAACGMVRSDVFFEVGGLSPTFPVNYNDVDFSLKLRQAGYRCVVSPFARMYHFESMTRVAGVSPYELQELHARWARHMQVDPFS